MYCVYMADMERNIIKLVSMFLVPWQAKQDREDREKESIFYNRHEVESYHVIATHFMDQEPATMPFACRLDSAGSRKGSVYIGNVTVL
jgi:hypothetical protein